MLKFRKTLDGSTPVTMLLKRDATNTYEGDILFWGSSGYVLSGKDGSAITSLLAGVSEGSVAAAGWTDGDTIAVQVNHSAVYGADTSAAIVATDLGTNVGLQNGGVDTADILNQASAQTNFLGIARIVKILTTTGTSQTCEVVLNYASPEGE